MMQDPWTSRWNERFSEEGFAYGDHPNEYLREKLQGLPPGSILFPAEGEGRNAVYAASLGWKVSAFDISEAGRKKALQLADEKGVTIDYHLGELESLSYQQGQFDVIALIYAHFPAAIKSKYHQALVNYLRPGGLVIFEAFSKDHPRYQALNEGVGGPKDLPSLFSIEEIRTDFAGFEFLELNETEIELREGKYHNGLGSVIRFVGRRGQ